MFLYVLWRVSDLILYVNLLTTRYEGKNANLSPSPGQNEILNVILSGTLVKLNNSSRGSECILLQYPK